MNDYLLLKVIVNVETNSHETYGSESGNVIGQSELWLNLP